MFWVALYIFIFVILRRGTINPVLWLASLSLLPSLYMPHPPS